MLAVPAARRTGGPPSSPRALPFAPRHHRRREPWARGSEKGPTLRWPLGRRTHAGPRRSRRRPLTVYYQQQHSLLSTWSGSRSARALPPRLAEDEQAKATAGPRPRSRALGADPVAARVLSATPARRNRGGSPRHHLGRNRASFRARTTHQGYGGAGGPTRIHNPGG